MCHLSRTEDAEGSEACCCLPCVDECQPRFLLPTSDFMLPTLFISHRGHTEGAEGVYGWAPQAATLLRTFTSYFRLHASYFLMGLCYNTAETVTYSEE